jgi:DNA invertase Pin-like site-specific DNA recombinase
MPGADDLMMRVYAAMAQKERELISERTKAALAAAKARGARLGGDRGYRPRAGPDSGSATLARREAAERAAHRLLLEVNRLREAGITSMQGLAQALTKLQVSTPRGAAVWTHTTVGRLLNRAGDAARSGDEARLYFRSDDQGKFTYRSLVS